MTIPFIDLKGSISATADRKLTQPFNVFLRGVNSSLVRKSRHSKMNLPISAEQAHAIAVANGTDAIQLALLACGIQPGDEVITSAFTAVATVAAIEIYWCTSDPGGH